MDTAIQTTTDRLGESFVSILTANVWWTLLCFLLGAVIGILAAEFAKRSRWLFGVKNMSMREYRRRSQLIATLVGGTAGATVAMFLVVVPPLQLAGVFLMVFAVAAMLSPILYDFVRRFFPAAERVVLRRLRGGGP